MACWHSMFPSIPIVPNGILVRGSGFSMAMSASRLQWKSLRTRWLTAGPSQKSSLEHHFYPGVKKHKKIKVVIQITICALKSREGVLNKYQKFQILSWKNITEPLLLCTLPTWHTRSMSLSLSYSLGLL